METPNINVFDGHPNCIMCANAWKCPTWKAREISLRNRIERLEPLNLIQLELNKINTGRFLAGHCEKFLVKLEYLQ